MSAVLDLCDKWDMLSKGETPTTKAVREAHAEDVAKLAAVVAYIDDPANYPMNEDHARFVTGIRAVLHPDPSEAGA